VSFAVSDAVSLALHTALNGLSQRQQVIADNIANVDTPGFRAQSVEFEASLQDAIDNGSLEPGSGAVSSVAATEVPTDTPVGANGNNVDLRKESIAAIQTQYQYQIMGRAISDRSSRLSTMGGAF
jgi:flagellar basal-body rod protein FlgB